MKHTSQFLAVWSKKKKQPKVGINPTTFHPEDKLTLTLADVGRKVNDGNVSRLFPCLGTTF